MQGKLPINQVTHYREQNARSAAHEFFETTGMVMGFLQQPFKQALS